MIRTVEQALAGGRRLPKICCVKSREARLYAKAKYPHLKEQY
jgi:hypothetical protein